GTDQDTAVGITLQATDPDADTLTYAIVTGPAHGSLSGSGANRTYTPNAGYFGPDSFTFKANDGSLDSNTATVSITVKAVNHAPVASDGSATTDQDTAVAITLQATDPDGDTLTYAPTSAPSHGVLSGSGANRTYTPNAGYSGSDSFTFTASDGHLDCSDSDGDVLVYALVTNASHGTATVGPDGHFTYAPAAGYTGPDSFTF